MTEGMTYEEWLAFDKWRANESIKKMKKQIDSCKKKFNIN